LLLKKKGEIVVPISPNDFPLMAEHEKSAPDIADTMPTF
jgi:hypothetical protein